MTLDKTHPKAYAAAAHLIEWGVPLFIARRAPDFPHGGSGDTGYEFPRAWQEAEPDLAVLDRWQEGDALCAVMGKVVDGIDVDPRSGPGIPADVMPHSYGRQRTPSGGTHDLIAALGERSWNGMFPGVDYKAGQGARGKGFLFIAPTVRLSKTDGELREYTWESPPDIDMDIASDKSGEALRERIAAHRRGPSLTSYDSDNFQELTPAQQKQAREYVEDTLTDWSWRLGAASGWPEGERDERGRGWEALVRDFAWTVALMAVAPWTGLDPDEAEEVYHSRVPKVMLDDPKCRGKWHAGLLSKAEAEPVALPPWWSNDVFEYTLVLRHIRQLAYSRVTSPHSLLAAILARVLAEVPPTTVLPPVVGTPASLNLGVTLVGPSGSGKSTAIGLSREALGPTGLDQQQNLDRSPGSGEGLAATYLEDERVVDDNGKLVKTGNKTVIPDPRRVMIVEEVGSLAAGAKRQGATIMAELRKALRGEMLGQENATTETRRHVPAGAYRLVAMVGVQPEHSHALLNPDEVSAGTPQRFLWASATDSSIPREPVPDPGPLDWTLPALPDQIDYPERIKAQVRESHWLRAQGNIGSERGHLTLTALKVATALALLHGETEITEQWWEIASALTDRSMEVQRECYAALAAAAARENESRGKAQAQVDAARDEHSLEIAYNRIQRRVMRAVEEKGYASVSQIKRRLKNDDRELLDDVLGQLAEEGLIEVKPYDNHGKPMGERVWKVEA